MKFKLKSAHMNAFALSSLGRGFKSLIPIQDLTIDLHWALLISDKGIDQLCKGFKIHEKTEHQDSGLL